MDETSRVTRSQLPEAVKMSSVAGKPVTSIKLRPDQIYKENSFRVRAFPIGIETASFAGGHGFNVVYLYQGSKAILLKEVRFITSIMATTLPTTAGTYELLTMINHYAVNTVSNGMTATHLSDTGNPSYPLGIQTGDPQNSQIDNPDWSAPTINDPGSYNPGGYNQPLTYNRLATQIVKLWAQTNGTGCFLNQECYRRLFNRPIQFGDAILIHQDAAGSAAGAVWDAEIQGEMMYEESEISY
jgi:hypothetical protein